MKVRKHLILTTALLALALPAQAKTAKHTGAGTIGCAVFSAQVKDVKGYGVDLQKFYFSWAQGFMSSINTYLDADGKPTHDLLALSATEQMRDLHAYCESHPSEQYVYAVEDLFKHLPRVVTR